LPNSSDKADFYELITDATITAGVVDATALASNAVTTAKILDDNVTTAKILDDNITTAKILDDNITTAKILDANVTLAKLATDAHTTGTFTPDLQFGAAKVGITGTQTGTYVKQGTLVTCFIVIGLTSKGSSAGSATIEDLPFTVGSGIGAPVGSIKMDTISFADYPFVDASGTSLRLYEISTAGTVTNLTNANFADTSSLNITIQYTV